MTLTEAALAQLNEIARTWNTILTIQTRFERADAAMRHLPDLLAEVAALRERAELAEGALRAGDENQRLQLAAPGREAEPNPSNSSNSCQEGSGDV